MKNKTTPVHRSRAEILAEIEALPPSVHGKICSFRHTRKNGTIVTYHNLQWWENGRNHSLAIPVGKLEDFRRAVLNGDRLQKLVREISLADACEIIASPSPLKKKLSEVVTRSSQKLKEITVRAVESIEANGIGCTVDLERNLYEAATGMCREIMEALLTSEAARRFEDNRKVGERNGGIHEAIVTTRFGNITVRRLYLHGKGKKTGRYPFDEKLGLIHGCTPAVADEACRLCVERPYKAAAEEFARSHSFDLSGDRMRRLVHARQTQVKKFIGDKKLHSREEYKDHTVCVMADGTGVPLRRESLKGVKGRKGRAKTREFKVGAIFTSTTNNDNEPFRDTDTTTYTATSNRWKDFGTGLRAEFDRRFPSPPQVTLFITDGGKWLRSVHRNYFPFSVEILDFYHASEHLKPLLEELGFTENSKEWKAKRKYWEKKMREGRVDLVISAAEKMKPDTKLKALAYFKDNKDRMNYAEYRANGWFIGSGVIESGCKTIIGQRFKCSGMNWTLTGADALLQFRVLAKSNRLEEFFNYSVKGLAMVSA